MIHEGKRLEKAIKSLERQLEEPVDDKRRAEISKAIQQLRGKLRAWERPH